MRVLVESYGEGSWSDSIGDGGSAAGRAALRRPRRQPKALPAPIPAEAPEGDAELALTWHGRRRMAQRSLSTRQVAYVLDHAVLVHRTGAEFYVLRRRDVAPADRRIDAYAKVAGAVVLVQGATLVTAYRNPEAYRRILKKEKHRLVAA